MLMLNRARGAGAVRNPRSSRGVSGAETAVGSSEEVVVNRHVTLVLVLIALLAVSCAPLPAPIPAPATPESSAALTNPASGAATYTSTALGVSFSYLPDQNGQMIGVLEQGDRIYVYPANMEPAAGQWVQVFPRQPDESLADAIRRVIMPGHPEADCLVTAMAELPGASGMQPASFDYAAITVRRAAGEDEAVVLPRWRTCPQPYTVVGGIGYFQADAAHPDRFVFFSIGQYAILAGPDLPWQETIRFE